MIKAEDVKSLRVGDTLCLAENNIWNRCTSVIIYDIIKVNSHSLRLRERISKDGHLVKIQAEGISQYQIYTPNMDCYLNYIHEICSNSKIGDIVKKLGVCENKQLFLYYQEDVDYAKRLEEVQKLSKEYSDVCRKIGIIANEHKWLR